MIRIPKLVSEDTQMKKIIALIISATLLLSLSSCANSNGTSTADKETTNDAVSGEDAGGNSDATKNNNSDAGAIVLLPGELYQFDKVADGGPVIKGLTLKGNQLGSSEFNDKDPDVKGIRCIFELNEWVEFYPDTNVNEGLYVYVYKHADDANVYTDMGFTEEDTKVLATCNLEKPEEADYQWGALYLNPEYADPDVYDIVFVKDGKAVAVMEAKFFDESSIEDKSDDELRAMMKDF
jgi:ABC-type oligopeptide transport system substrate-binding subunit